MKLTKKVPFMVDQSNTALVVLFLSDHSKVKRSLYLFSFRWENQNEFEILPICLCSYKTNTLKISHS